MLEHGTKEKESGLLPTPRARDHFPPENPKRIHQNQKGWSKTRKKSGVKYGATLPDVINKIKNQKMNFPTPTTQETEHPLAELTKTGRRKTKNGKTSHSLNLADTVKLFPTPMANEVRLGYQKRDTGKKGTQKSLTTIVIDKEGGQEKAIGQLNSEWVEWLMGYPIGWTDIGSENQRESQELGQDKQTECKDSKDSETL